MRSRNSYCWPIEGFDQSHLLQGSPAHMGDLKFAVDFLCAEGTPVQAALDGEVVFVKQDSDQGGPNRKFYNDGNRIVLKHSLGEFSAYEHLAYNSALVNVGQKVKQGQTIAISGNTGFSFEPHLHFEVFRNPTPDESEGETLEIVWYID